MISLCMIVKNEEQFLPNCLNSVKGLADEIIVVDTGSTDRTVEIAEKAGAAVLYYEWDGDTAKARNFGLKHAKGDWILVLDADEELTPKEHESIRKLTEKGYDAYYLVQLNYTDEIGHLLYRPLKSNAPESKGFKGYFPVEIIRFFRNRKGIEFRSIVHERLNESIKELGLKAARTDVPIHHYQMLKGKEEMKRKQLAFLELFERKSKDYPNDAKLWYDMGVIYFNYKKDTAKAVECFNKAASLNPKYTAPLLSLATVYLRNNELKKAEETYSKALEIDPKNPAVHYNLGNVYLQEKRLMDAAKSYSEALKLNPEMMQAYNNLGNILVLGGKYEQAIKAFNNAIRFGHPRKELLKKKVEELEKLKNGQ